MAGPVLNQNVKRLAHTLLLWMPLWLGTTVAFGLLGAVYAFAFKQDLWLSSQALLVRDETNSSSTAKMGRFDSATQMKAAQETILEVARHEQVVAQALKTVGQEPSWLGGIFGKGNWPSSSLVKGTAGSLIAIRAPKGAEFGATEVIYLDVKQSSPQRALAFNRALTEALQVRLQEVRKVRAESIRTELTHARDMAREQLKQATEQLSTAERTAGVELSDLRGMTDMIAGSGTSRNHLDQLKSEIRGVETKLQEQGDDLKLLEGAIADPQSFVVAPSSIISSQPGLKRLREGYAEAHLTSSQLAGKFTEEHPLLIASRRAQQEIQQRLIGELEASITNLSQEIDGSTRKLDRLKKLQSETENKLSSLAEHRATYANLISEVKTRTTILETAERELAEIEAAGTASYTTSLISKMDEPTVSEKPVGPGRTIIAGGCSVAGLMLGLALVFLLTPNENGRRFGRRANDLGRRREDALPATPPMQDNSELIASTLAATANLLDDAAQADTDPVVRERIDRALQAKPALERSQNRPAPVFYDESTIAKLKEGGQAAVDALLQESNDANQDSARAAVAVAASKSNAEPADSNSEHPNDAGFRDFLLDELAKSNDRRQHPRPSDNNPRTVQLGMRQPTMNQS